jgi:hypothetical protein
MKRKPVVIEIGRLGAESTIALFARPTIMQPANTRRNRSRSDRNRRAIKYSDE